MSARLGPQAVLLLPEHVDALRVGCRKGADGEQVGGAVPREVARYLADRQLVVLPWPERNPWWVLTTASGAEMLCMAEAT